MTRFLARAALAMMLCMTVSLAYAEQRGKGGAKGGGRSGGEAERKPEGRNEGAGRESSRKPQGAEGARSGGNKSPGGAWSDRTHSGMTSNQHPGSQHSAAAGAAAGNAAGKNNSSKATGAQGAAAGSAAAKRNAPAATGAQGAAAGAAAANRNAPAATGAQGAAAGAAAANRNSPQVSGAQGAAAGAAAANRNSPQFSGAQGAAAGAAAANRNSPAGYAAVRGSVNTPGMYGGDWYGAHPGAWAPTGWAAGAAWRPTTWGAVAGMYGYGNAAPISYDYGNSVNYQQGNVVVNGQSVGTAEDYSQQASDLAATGAAADTSATDKWLPLGVFAMVRNEKQHPQLIVQLAINEQGILRGNFTDEVTDHTQPLHGAVDKETQRAAWTVGDNTQTVMEAGLNNLTQSEAPALVHKNGKTDHWILVRLDQPQ